MRTNELNLNVKSKYERFGDGTGNFLVCGLDSGDVVIVGDGEALGMKETSF